MFLNFLHTGTFDTEAEQYWDKFYEMHQNKFFKDRKWLFLEFPELLPSKSQATTRRQEMPLPNTHAPLIIRGHVKEYQ
ncbi:putative methyltransferase-like protein 8 [Scophthalmus maximus]|uniref:Putative methyltransferase-like protein 8 n=1 Tax=Scophthalmus maximus TaxID=52904 RepID=A0A2U9CBF9_SCOMX|nr:putative methyltransferase-like protein 8 [Scophthalmus maximus]